MIKRHAFLFAFLISVLSLQVSQAQDCSQAFAGTMSITPLEETSVDILNREYTLCYGQSLEFNHNGDQNFGGDPDGNTSPGIGYMLFATRPSAQRGTWDDLVFQNQAVRGQDGEVIIVRGDGFGNNAILHNTNQYANIPNTVWVAPVILNNASEAFGGNPGAEGSCVHINTDVAFQVRLLPPLNVEFVEQSDSLLVVNVTGGLPEVDRNELYSYEFVTKPGIANEIIQDEINVIPFNSAFEFELEIDNFYSLRIYDGQGCSKGSIINLDGPASPPFGTISVQCSEALATEEICIPVRFQTDSMIFLFDQILSYDPSVLEFLGLKNPTGVGDIRAEVDTTNSSQILVRDLSFSQKSFGSTDFIAYEICFKATNQGGTYSPLEFTTAVSTSLTGISIVDARQVLHTGCIVPVLPNLQDFEFDYNACAGENGMISLSIFDLNGLGPFQITVTDNSGATVLSDNFNSSEAEFSFSPGANPHNIAITDASGNVATKLNVTFRTDPLTMEVEKIDAGCAFINGVIEVNYTGAIDSLILSVQGQNTGYSQNGLISDNSRFENLAPDVYTVTLTDPKNNCSVDTVLDLIDGKPTIEIEVDNSMIQDCNSMDSATVTITVKTGALTLFGRVQRIEITNNDGSFPFGVEPFITPLPELSLRLPVGSYYAVAWDANDCKSDEFPFNITPQIFDPPYTIESIQPFCSGIGRGDAGIVLRFDDLYQNMDVIVRNFGLPDGVGPEIIASQPADVGSDSLLDLLTLRTQFGGAWTDGQYFINVDNIDNACITAYSIDTFIPAIPMEADIDTGFECSIDLQGFVQISGLEGHPDFSYNIDWNGDTTVPFFPGVTQGGLSAGQTFRFGIIEEESGCRVNYQFEPKGDTTELTITAIDPSCPNSSDGRILLDIPPGQSVDSIIIVDQSGISLLFNGPYSGGDALTGLSNLDGLARLSSFSNGGCQRDTVTSLFNNDDIPEILRVQDVVISTPDCVGDPIMVRLDSTNFTDRFGIDPDSLLFFVGSQSMEALDLDSTYTLSLPAGSYSAFVTYRGCLSDSTRKFTFEDGQMPIPTLDQVVYNAAPGDIITVTETTGTFGMYAWTYGNAIVNAPATASSINIEANMADSICVQVFDNMGCTGFACAIVNLESFRQAQFPNIINTNDPLVQNRYFRPYFNEFAGLEAIENITIYNRLGQIVWQDIDVAPSELTMDYGWSGESLSGELLPADVYIYTVQVRYRDLEASVPWSGSVTLLR